MRVLSHVLDDQTSIPQRLRGEAAALQSLVMDNPSLGWERLVELMRPFASAIKRRPPTEELGRAIALDSFRRRCAKEEYRHLETETFRRLIEARSNPNSFLEALLKLRSSCSSQSTLG